MHRKKTHELIHAFIKPAVEPGKWEQVFPNAGLLLNALLEQALSHHKLDIISCDEYLLKTVFYPADAVGNKSETVAFKNSFLNAGQKSETQIFTYFANLSKKIEIQNNFMIVAGTQVVQQFIDHKK